MKSGILSGDELRRSLGMKGFGFERVEASEGDFSYSKLDRKNVKLHKSLSGRQRSEGPKKTPHFIRIA